MTRIQKLFIANLRFYRSQKKISQIAFSEQIGVSPNYLNAVENGKNFPSVEVLQKICNTLNILPYQLFLEKPILSQNYTDGNHLIQTLIDLKEKICATIDEKIPV